MNTQEILKKEVLTDADINYLAKHMNELTDKDKIRLGFISAPVKEKKAEEVTTQ